MFSLRSSGYFLNGSKSCFALVCRYFQWPYMVNSITFHRFSFTHFICVCVHVCISLKCNWTLNTERILERYAIHMYIRMNGFIRQRWEAILLNVGGSPTEKNECNRLLRPRERRISVQECGLNNVAQQWLSCYKLKHIILSFFMHEFGYKLPGSLKKFWSQCKRNMCSEKRKKCMMMAQINPFGEC